MISAYKHELLANPGKERELLALFPEFRDALGGLQTLTRRELLAGEPFSKWRAMPAGTLKFETRLSARQLKSVQNMLAGAVKSWQENLENWVRELITGSELPEHQKTVLYRINARKAWWVKELDLAWLADENGEFVPARLTDEDPQLLILSVNQEDLQLVRRLAKQAQKRCVTRTCGASERSCWTASSRNRRKLRPRPAASSLTGG